MNGLVDIWIGYDIASKSPDIGILKWNIYDQIMLMKAEQVDPFHKDVRIIGMHHKWHKVNIEKMLISGNTGEFILLEEK
jgi:hypothetical protein